MSCELLKLCEKHAGGKKKRTSSFLISASAFAFCRFSHALILASSLLALEGNKDYVDMSSFDKVLSL